MDLESWVHKDGKLRKMGSPERWVEKDGRGVISMVGNTYHTQEDGNPRKSPFWAVKITLTICIERAKSCYRPV